MYVFKRDKTEIPDYTEFEEEVKLHFADDYPCLGDKGVEEFIARKRQFVEEKYDEYKEMYEAGLIEAKDIWVRGVAETGNFMSMMYWA